MTDEEMAVEVHGVYCAQYEKNHGKPYWTGGDYSKLEESVKEYDRALVLWHRAKVQEAVGAALLRYSGEADKIAYHQGAALGVDPVKEVGS